MYNSGIQKNSKSKDRILEQTGIPLTHCIHQRADDRYQDKKQPSRMPQVEAESDHDIDDNRQNTQRNFNASHLFSVYKNTVPANMHVAFPVTHMNPSAVDMHLFSTVGFHVNAL